MVREAEAVARGKQRMEHAYKQAFVRDVLS